MFDIGWTELMVVAIVAILFVGPKELPGMLRMAGRTVKKVRGLAGDVQRQFDDALRDAELDDLKTSINEVRDLNPANALKDKLNPLKNELEKAERELNEKPEPAIASELEATHSPKKAVLKPSPRKAADKKTASAKTKAKKTASPKKAAAKKTAKPTT